MRPILLDHQQSTRRFRTRGLLLLAAGMVAVVAAVADYHELSSELFGLREQAELLDIRPDRRAFDKIVKPDDPRRSGAEAKRIDQVLRQLETPWGELFGAVEFASSKEVALLALQPDTQQRLIRLVAEAKAQVDMLEYVKRLSENAALSDVHLSDHQIQTQDPNRPLRFTVQATFIVQ